MKKERYSLPTAATPVLGQLVYMTVSGMRVVLEESRRRTIFVNGKPVSLLFPRMVFVLAPANSLGVFFTFETGEVTKNTVVHVATLPHVHTASGSCCLGEDAYGDRVKRFWLSNFGEVTSYNSKLLKQWKRKKTLGGVRDVVESARFHSSGTLRRMAETLRSVLTGHHTGYH